MLVLTKLTEDTTQLFYASKMFKKVQWGKYPSHLRVLLTELYESSNFSDVTIICDSNNKTFQVHKVILALYSDFFSDLLRHNDDEDVIIMPEVNHEDMVVIFNLMFTGKSSINIDRLGSLLSLAEELQIKNFEEDMFALQSQELKDSHTPKDGAYIKRLDIHPIREEKFINLKHPIPFDEIGEVKFIKTKEYFDCKLCGKEYATKGGVQQHHKREHLKKRYSCSACDAEFKTRDHLRTHFRVHHEGIKFGCTQCNATHATKSGLKMHIESVHEGRKLKCHICSKEFKQKGALKTHVEGKHYGRKYLCLHCHYSTGDTSNLNKHVKKMHPDIIKPKDPLDTKFRPYRPRSRNKEEPLEDRKVFMF